MHLAAPEPRASSHSRHFVAALTFLKLVSFSKARDRNVKASMASPSVDGNGK